MTCLPHKTTIAPKAEPGEFRPGDSRITEIFDAGSYGPGGSVEDPGGHYWETPDGKRWASEEDAAAHLERQEPPG